MKSVVPDSVLARTTKCRNDFSCPKTGTCGEPEKCRVQKADGENVLFLALNAYVNCPYHVHFGDTMICTCPTHYAIHKQGAG